MRLEKLATCCVLMLAGISAGACRPTDHHRLATRYRRRAVVGKSGVLALKSGRRSGLVTPRAGLLGRRWKLMFLRTTRANGAECAAGIYTKLLDVTMSIS